MTVVALSTLTVIVLWLSPPVTIPKRHTKAYILRI
jgi:hypothetical protein